MNRSDANGWTSAALVTAMIVASAAFVSVTVDPVFARDDEGGRPAEELKPPVIPEGPVSAEVARAGARAFADVARVLLSPRCRNCHPVGDAPLQTDAGRPHRMNITRKSVEAGLPCATCHQEKNADELGVFGGPPGAPHWGLPPAETPMVFEGRTPRQLCEQLKDPAQNGGRTLADLWQHAHHDPLVLWGWKPGGKRTLPPISHERFVEAFRVWAESRGACP